MAGNAATTLLVTGSAGRVGRALLPQLATRFGSVQACATPAQSAVAMAGLLAGRAAAPTHALLLHRPPDPVAPKQEEELAQDYAAWVDLLCRAGTRRVVLASSEHALLSPGTSYGYYKGTVERLAQRSTPATQVYYDRIGRVYDPDLGADPEPSNPVPATPLPMLLARLCGLLGVV